MSARIVPFLAAVVEKDSGGIDDLLSGFALSLRSRGRWVRGLVQTTASTPSGNTYIAVVDLDTGSQFPVGQSLFDCLPHNNRNCMPEAVDVLKRIVCDGADLVLINRFSDEEAAGRGFMAEMLLLANEEVPLLTVVPERYLTAWQTFAGGAAVILQPNLQSLYGWIFQAWGIAPFAYPAASLEYPSLAKAPY
jgi:hypothetical protein